MTTTYSRVAGMLEERRQELPAHVWAEIPVDLESVGKFWGVKKVVERPMDRPGFLYRIDGGGFIIFLNESDRGTRKRFTWAHELGHILMADHDSIGISCVKEGEIDRELERACDSIAAELLMPRESFGPLAESIGWQLAQVNNLANRFQVSLESAAIRMRDLISQPVVMSMWRAGKRHFSLLEYLRSHPNDAAIPLRPFINWKNNPDHFNPICEALYAPGVTSGVCRILVKRNHESKSRSYRWVPTKGLGIGQGMNRRVIAFHYLGEQS